MYKNYLLAFSFFIISLSTFSQTYSEEKIYSWYDQKIGIENTTLFQGIEYVETDRMINEQHKFFETQEFQEGIVTYNGQTFYEGFDESESRVGVAQKVSGPGFQGIIEIMIGIDPESEKIYGIRILGHEETPGLGANIEGQEYRNNFKDKQFADFKVVKREAQKPSEVEAIAGATISSRKVTNIVEKAITNIKNAYGGEK